MPQLEQGRDNPRSLKSAIKAARSARAKYEPHWKRYRNEICGPDYRKGEGVKRLTNYPYLFESTFLPELAARNPEVIVKAAREFTDGQMADAHGLAINVILQRQKFLDELRLMVKDGMYAFMFCKTGLYPMGSQDPTANGTEHGSFYGDPMWLDANMPFVERISPFKAIWDDSAASFSRCSYVGHEFERDSESVRLDDRYDNAAKLDLPDGKLLMTDHDREQYNAFESDEIPDFQKLIELYVRPTNCLYTLLETSKDEFVILRKVPYYGPPGGGYHLRGFIDATDRVIPIAPSVAWWQQYLELERNEQAANKQAWAEKRVATTSANDAEAAKKFKAAAPDDLVLDIPDVKEVSTGGVTADRMNYLNTRRAALEDSSAVASVRRSDVGGQNSATGDSIKNTAANNRINDMRGVIVEFVKEAANDIGYYVHSNPTIQIFTTIMSEEGLPADVMIQGGPSTDPETGAPLADQPDWSSFSLDIDPRTLYLDNDEIKRMKSMEDATFMLTVLEPSLQMQGMTLNKLALAKWLEHNASIPGLVRMIVPMSPMAMMMGQQAQMAGTPEEEVAGLADTKSPIQQQVQNDPVTNQANSQSAKAASPGRKAVTPPKSNNKGKR
jgi:hypothetical protein